MWKVKQKSIVKIHGTVKMCDKTKRIEIVWNGDFYGEGNVHNGFRWRRKIKENL